MAILAGSGTFLAFTVAALAGLVCPILTQFLDLAGTMFMTLLAILQHYLMFLVGKGHLAHGCRQLNNISGEDRPSESGNGEDGNNGGKPTGDFHDFLLLIVLSV